MRSGQDKIMVKYLLKQIREERGLTLRELEKLSGVSRSYLWEVESNYKHLTIPMALNIAKALKIDIKELFTTED